MSLPDGIEVDVWLVGLASGDLSAAQDGLTPAERSRAARFATRELAQRWAAARAALRSVLEHVSHSELDDVELLVSEHGKPYLPGLPHFNLSHCAHFALIGVSPDAEIGVDIECLDRTGTLDRGSLAGMLHPVERREVAALAGEESAAAVGRAWTRKEACLKAAGIGLGVPPNEVLAGVAPITAPASVTVAGHACRVRDLDAAAGHAAACAVVAPGYDLVTRQHVGLPAPSRQSPIQ